LTNPNEKKYGVSKIVLAKDTGILYLIFAGHAAPTQARGKMANWSLKMVYSEALNNFLVLLDERSVRKAEAEGSTVWIQTHVVRRPGKKYDRVVKSTPGRDDASAYCFIDRTTGDILKPASWKSPAPHPRGNIFGANPLAGTGHHGVAYLR
jgi:hypothetical protein